MNLLAQNTNVIIALTAIGALVFSGYSIIRNEQNSKFQRQHNKLSVKPIGQISVGDWQDRLFVGIENVGSGPLIIRKLGIFSAGELQSKHLIELMPKLPPFLYWRNFVREGIEGRAILPGNILNLVELVIDEEFAQQAEFRNSVRRTLGQYEVRLEYEDIYGEKVREIRRSLNWFVRHWNDSNEEKKR